MREKLDLAHERLFQAGERERELLREIIKMKTGAPSDTGSTAE